MELSRTSDAAKVAKWLNIPLEEFLDLDMELSEDDLICAGVTITPAHFGNEDDDEDYDPSEDAYNRSFDAWLSYFGYRYED